MDDPLVDTAIPRQDASYPVRRAAVPPAGR